MASGSAPYHGVPGTIRLVDEQLHGPTGDIVLHPHPSADPEDPLNWSRPRKMLAISMVYLYVFGIGIATAVQYSVLNQIADAQGLQVSQLNLGTGLMFLFLGWSNLIWQPIAMTYGRRGVYIISIFLSIIPMVWAPYSKGAGQWYAHRILIGIFAAPVESLPEVSVPDLFFAHERGTYMSLFAFVLCCSNFLAPLCAGFINDGVGWHWVMFFGAITLAVCGIIMFFCMEETIYFRQSSEGEPDSDNSDKPGTEGHSEAAASYPPPMTYLQKLNFVFKRPGRPNAMQAVGKVGRALTIMVFFPNILWAGVLYGLNLSWNNIMNGTLSSILGAAPYNFSPAMIGVSYVAPIIGGALAFYWSGQFADFWVLRLARRNKGIREPEQRLWMLLVSSVVSTSGILLWGVGASREVHWMGLMFGLLFVAFGVINGTALTLAYSVDCFKDIAGESMVTVILLRNTIGFAFSYALNPWIDSMGLQNCFISVAMLSLISTMSFLPIMYWGKRLRRFSSKKYWQYVAEDKNFPSSH